MSEEHQDAMKLCRECAKEIPRRATRCPYCRANQHGWARRHPFLAFFLILIGVSALLSAIGKSVQRSQPGQAEATASSSSTALPPLVTPIPDADKQSLARTYCQTHKDTMNLPDFTSQGYPPIQNDDNYARTFAHGGSLTQADCMGVIDAMETKSGESYQNIQRIASGTIWMGMLPFEAELSVGDPNKINTTTTQVGENDQWVYGAGINNSYLYFQGSDKDHLKLASWQNF